MKKLLSVVLIMLMVFSMAACGESASEEGTNYPNGTITNIVNFAAGGGTDICDRALVEAVAAECRLQVVGCQHVEAAGISEQHAYGEDRSQQRALDSRFDVVRRSAVAVAL